MDFHQFPVNVGCMARKGFYQWMYSLKAIKMLPTPLLIAEITQ